MSLSDQTAFGAGTDRSAQPFDARAAAAELVPALESRAGAADAGDRFVADNFALLRDAGLNAAGVPRELGGGGAGIGELADMIRILARACGSTGLAFAMHTHQVAVPAWRWRHQGATMVEPLLRRIVAERLVLLSSGGSDWIAGSGRARRVEGGFRVSARKVFVSGAPAGDLLVTGAVLEEGDTRSVLHFAVPMRAAEVRIEDTWRALGMRGTGSHDVVIEDVFVPEAAVVLARPAGRWHPLFEIIATVAFPLIYAAYLGVAEAARDIAVELARSRGAGPEAVALAGELDTELGATRLAHAAMVATAERGIASPETVSETMIGRALVVAHGLRTVELALELAGGAGFYRVAGLEQRFRDMQGARYHPMRSFAQRRFTGSLALGQPVDEVF